jgi:fatty acyl-CoA reductase
VREFYKDKSIMLTGCTGFLGKIILEKILRTCSDFKKVYILIRPKKGTTVAKRL